MNARSIQREIMRDRWQCSICCPNYTPPKWWECDVFELTKSGYFREYEIKLTRSDFRADAKKYIRRWNYQTDTETVRSKHTELSARAACAPAQFWFVAPPDVIPVDELPEWAGLIIVESRPGWRNLFLTEQRRAPRLHRRKIDEKLRQDLLTTFYFRFQRLFLRHENETEKEDHGALDQNQGRDQTANQASNFDQSKDLAQALAQN